MKLETNNGSDDLMKKYKHKITPGEKSVEELIDFLKGKVDIVETATTELDQSFYEYYIIGNVVRGTNENLIANELNFIIYKVLKNNRSNPYYQCYVPNIRNPENPENLKNPEDAPIYVVFEKRTRRIYTNSNRLRLELYIERGVSQYDYDNDTDLLHSYLFYLHSYSTGEY